MPVKGGYLLIAGAGGVFFYSGIRGKGVTDAFRKLIGGQSPNTAANTTAFTLSGTNSGTNSATGTTVSPQGGNPSGGNTAQNQKLGQLMAAAYGWGSGAEWTALNNIVMSESGWDANSANPTSDARGIAQNINGWSSSYQAGNAQQQIAWLLAYIKGRYGDPIKAWQFHLANGWY